MQVYFLKLSVHIRALEEDLCATHAVKQLLGLSAVRFEFLARHLQRVDLITQRTKRERDVT